MELKDISMYCLYLRVTGSNPFNGIERHRDAEHHRNDNTQGIHSMELKVDISSSTVFDMVTRIHSMELKVARYAFGAVARRAESIQWN